MLRKRRAVVRRQSTAASWFMFAGCVLVSLSVTLSALSPREAFGSDDSWVQCTPGACDQGCYLANPPVCNVGACDVTPGVCGSSCRCQRVSPITNACECRKL